MKRVEKKEERERKRKEQMKREINRTEYPNCRIIST